MKFIRRFAIVLFTIVALFVVAGFVLSAMYGDKAKEYLLTEVNARLKTKAEVGEVGFSIFKNFPNASIYLKDVKLEEDVDSKVKNLLFAASEVRLIFSVFSLFSDNITVKKISIHHGNFNIYIDENGKGNYNILKPSTGEGDNKDSGFELEKVLFEYVKLSYVNNKDKQLLQTVIRDGSLSGKFASDIYDLKVDIDMLVERFAINDINYVEQKESKLSLALVVDDKNSKYTFGKSGIAIAGLKFDVNGWVQNGEKYTDMDMEVTAHSAEVSAFLSMLPPRFAEHFKDYTSQGKFSFNSTIKGRSDSKQSPAVNVDFSIADGYLKPKGSPAALEKLNLEGTYANKPDRFQLNHFNAMLGNKPVEGNLRLEDFDNPLLSFNTKAVFDLNYLSHFIPIDTLQEIHGELTVNASFAGYLKEIPRKDLSNLHKITASGEMTVKDARFKLKKNPLEFKDMNGTVKFNNSDIEVNGFTGNISNSDFALTGVCKNLLLYALTKDQNARIEASLVSKNIDLNELLQSKSNVTTTADTAYALSFSPRLSCDLTVFINDMKFRRFHAEDIKGKMLLRNQMLTTSLLRFKSMDGNVSIQGDIDASRGSRIYIACAAEIRKMDINKLFYQMENFGQTMLVDKNIKGIANADIQFSSEWSRALVADMDKIYSKATITIDNGQLINFEPMLALSKYIKVSELRDIKFSTLQNQIEIKKQLIYIPSMEIRSSALDLTASGVHSFDNIIDYKLQLLLSQLLGKKVRESSTEFGDIKDDGLGRTSVFIAMKGKADDPKFTLDKKAVTQKIAQEIKEEKQTFKGVLKQELGLFKKDSTVVVPSKKQGSRDVIGIDRGEDEPNNEKQSSKTDRKRQNAFRNFFNKSEE